MGVDANDWWRGAVIYQIYPRSFFDSNGDGVGDLPGITQKLSYIAGLGVDAVWLSPFFTSPMKDFGYDVADYCDVDPLFGSLADFQALLDEAHRLNLKVIIDQVYSHTSDQHRWFKASRQSRDNDFADWYVWADAKADGTPPNNWLSIFGGSAWQWDSRRRQYYLHNFLTSQPDLNFHNPAVQDAILDVMRFWLEMGVDGFRLDVVNMYFHDAELRDNPVVSQPSERHVGSGDDNPWSKQFHKYQITQPDNLAFLQRLRQVMDQYRARTSVGEIGSYDSLRVMADYTSGGDKLHMAYTFDLLGTDHSATYLRSVLTTLEDQLEDGWPNFAISNHDVMRSVSRWGGEAPRQDFAKASLALLLSLRGSSCLYQGEELGLPEGNVPFERLQDPYGIEFWPEFKGRDGCRTPMAWTTTGGFTTADDAWLPLDPAHLPLSAEAQDHNPDSVLNWVRRFLPWRREQSALVAGDFTWLADDQQEAILFARHSAEQTLWIGINLTGNTLTVDLPVEATALPATGFTGTVTGKTMTLPAYSAVFAEPK
ncbi:alpha-amylase family glycosyl hydrolase [Salinispirillum marinum]|uniref:Alpha-amylase family glycosyl hydrolase n=2 Tax=Saccharospirillaceae TaxID=255527 RepID=A0ABV8BD07_9GAMM